MPWRQSLLFLLILWSTPSANASAQRPNIVVLLADDLGYSDVGCYGSEIATSNIDRLARGGLRFTQFYNNAKCEPSRTSVLTGLYPQQVVTRETSNAVTIAQVLKSAGYRTLMTGRNGGLGDRPPWDCGFDRFYGLLDSGCCNYFNPGLRRPGEREPGRKYPGEQRAWGRDGTVLQPYTPANRDFYSTDAFTDCAIEYLNEYGTQDRPFFLYVPYTAPHFPLHARPEDIAKYRGKYMLGWDALRKQRQQRLVQLGLTDEKWGLSPRDPNAPVWEDLDREQQDQWDLHMAVYAAMIDRMDQGIGRILAKLRELGLEENTLVLFLSDNGACAEDDRAFGTTAPGIAPGPIESYRTQGVPWARASNTPLRQYKWWLHEGGIATPLIAYWPAVIKDGGRITHQVGHVMDLMATCLDVAGADYPGSYDGQTIVPLEGKSLLPVFEGKQRDGYEALFWQFGGCSAVRKGNWKLIAPHPDARTGIDYFSIEGDMTRKGPNEHRWELYDLASDRTERKDLAEMHPEMTRAMAELYATWAAHVRQVRQ